MGYVKYGLVFLISAWMFFMGVLVGRGTAPVSFDTQRLQKRLARIAEDCSQRLNSVSKPELVFYKVLKKPARTGGGGLDAGEILPGNHQDGIQGGEHQEKAVKRSRKTLSLKNAEDKDASLQKENVQAQVSAMSAVDVKPPATGISPVISSAEAGATAGKNSYTIQVASFKTMEDAENQISSLKKKGYTSYPAVGKVGDAVWVRVRIGAFASRDEAAAQLRQLEGNGIKGLIIKKD